MTDKFVRLGGLANPGIVRDAPYLLDTLLAYAADRRPEALMTDTGGSTDATFGVCWFLGYARAPRLADVGGSQLWRWIGRRTTAR